MGFIIFTVLLMGLTVVGVVIGRKMDDDARGGLPHKKIIGVLTPIVLGTVILSNAVFSAMTQVPAGQIGVVYEFGAIKGQVPEGLQWVAPWRSVQLANIQVERHVFERLASFSKETQDVFVKATLNIKVSPETIQELYRTVGVNYFSVLVESRVAQNFKDETVKYNSVDIAPHREDIRKAVRDRLEKELSPYSIQVVDLLLDNVDFTPAFKTAVENKQVATQNALTEEQNVLVERHKAEQAVETARGQGQSTLVRAEKQAEANRKLAASLTPELIQYTAIEKMAPGVQTVILPAGNNFLLNGDMLKRSQPTASAK